MTTEPKQPPNTSPLQELWEQDPAASLRVIDKLRTAGYTAAAEARYLRRLARQRRVRRHCAYRDPFGNRCGRKLRTHEGGHRNEPKPAHAYMEPLSDVMHPEVRGRLKHELDNHRTGRLRVEARGMHLASNYLRGTSYALVEGMHTKKPVSAVRGIVKRWVPAALRPGLDDWLPQDEVTS